MRETSHMYGRERSIHTSNEARVIDQQPYYPPRSSAAVFAQQNAQPASRYTTSPSPYTSPSFSPSSSPSSSYYYHSPSLAPAPSPSYSSPSYLTHPADTPYPAPSAPTSAVGVPRPVRRPAGYMPYTQTSAQNTTYQSKRSRRPHKTQPPINYLNEDFPASTGGSATYPNTFVPQHKEDVAGAGAGVGARASMGAGLGAHESMGPGAETGATVSRGIGADGATPGQSGLNYEEYLSVPQGKKDIFSNKAKTTRSPAKLFIALGAILAVLVIVLIIVWGFASMA